MVIPPQNDVDLHANDMNFVAIAENGKLVGFNLLVGGGLSIEHGNKKTHARQASEFGYIPLEHTLAVAEAVVTTQRDWGQPHRSQERQNQIHAGARRGGRFPRRSGKARRYHLRADPAVHNSPAAAIASVG